MIHNSFDVSLSDYGYVAISHNFKEISGQGKTEAEAINDMDRKIKYYQDNDPQGFMKNLRQRIENGMRCGCGLKLKSEDKVLGLIS